MGYLGYIILFGFISGFLGTYVARQKNRSTTEGFILGFFFSLIGVIILALLPSSEKPIKRKQYISPTKSIRQKEPLSSDEKNIIGVFAIIIMIIVIYTLWRGRQ